MDKNNLKSTLAFIFVTIKIRLWSTLKTQHLFYHKAEKITVKLLHSTREYRTSIEPTLLMR